MTAPTPAEASQLFRDAPLRHLPVSGGEAAYRRIGHGPDVLFVHGWPVSSATFRQLLPHLADHVTCHLVDLPGAGSSRFPAAADLSIGGHVTAVREVVDQLGFTSYAAVGHDSGGLIARHATTGDPRLRALGLVDTEQTGPLSPLFRAFLASGRLPGVGGVLRRLFGAHRLRRSPLVLGGAFTDPALLDGEFDEFFLAPIRDDPARLAAAVAVLRSFDTQMVRDLDRLHRDTTVPVALVWGEDDPFFPASRARAMVDTFPDATLHVVPGARLFAHEEKPADVAAALLPVLTAAAV
ncbi:hydrolase, alpha/beta domain protein [Aeromicrobium marinum DSM 15272]|uniref:Hydrolase, alpha/beta domain protein n=1 Tax=Aeromicrobium marinum DSM 15272 TaxID=585531 RepID=E2SFZ0_9ACTN|nr:alpha/beta fold hydrolase [Aeromicrobium marinum]EFQ81937.1 hydrolase, alpha/beta domain protein [Aeromicrobium marinum DSM 15272]